MTLRISRLPMAKYLFYKCWFSFDNQLLLNFEIIFKVSFGFLVPRNAGAINGNFDLQHFFQPITRQQTIQNFNFVISLVERNDHLLHENLKKWKKAKWACSFIRKFRVFQSNRQPNRVQKECNKHSVGKALGVAIIWGCTHCTVPNESYHFWAVLLHKWLF